MKRTYLVGALLVMLAPATRPLGAQSPCMAASDSVTILTRDAFVSLVTTADSTNAAYRARHDLPLVAPPEVETVADSTVCSRAVAALSPFSGGSPFPEAFVLRIGSTRFIAYNFRQRAAGNFCAIVYDTAFTKLATIPF